MSNFIEAFILVFVAEMGDKSQLLSLAFATKYKLRTVIIGIAIGIGLNHALAILAASFISDYIDLNIIKLIAGFVFIIFGLTSLRLEYGEDDDEEKNYLQSFGPVVTIAATFFIGELGDKTQILAMTLGAIAENKLLVFLATFSSMMVVSLLGILVGRVLKKKIPEVTMNIIAAFLFLFFGFTTLYGNLENVGLSKIYVLPVLIVTIIFGIFIYKDNMKRRDQYYMAEISRNLENCVGCTEEYCNCETRDNIEELTSSYLGEDVAFLGNIIKYLEESKKISPKKYYNLYKMVKKNEFDETIEAR